MSTVHCPHCGYTANAGPGLAGFVVACPSCTQPFRVPGRHECGIRASRVVLGAFGGLFFFAAIIGFWIGLTMPTQTISDDIVEPATPNAAMEDSKQEVLHISGILLVVGAVLGGLSARQLRHSAWWMAKASPRRPARYSLRTLFVIVTALAILCGYVGWQVRIVEHRKAMLLRFTQLGGHFDFDTRDSAIPMIRRWFGDHELCCIYSDNLIPREDMQEIRRAFPEADYQFASWQQ